MTLPVYEKNLKALEAVSPDAARAVISARGEPEGVEFFLSKSGAPTARYTDADGRTTQLHSSYDPVKEAVKYVNTYTPGFGKWLAWLGPGLWYGVRAMKKRMFHCPMCVVEADPEMLRAVMERVPIDDVLTTPGIRVVTGSVEDVKSQLQAEPIRIESPRNMIVFYQAVSMRTAACSEIKDFIERLSIETPPYRDPENVVRREAFGPLNPLDLRILITTDDRYSDAVSSTLTPHGVQVKCIFDFPDVDA